MIVYRDPSPKVWLSYIMMSIVLAATLLIFPHTACSAEEIVDRIAAIVGDEIILLSEVKQTVQLEMWQIGIDPRTEDPEKLRKLEAAVFESMISDMILLAKAKEDTTIKVEPKEVEAALKQQINEMKRERGEDEFQRQLKEEGLTERELRSKFRKIIRNYLMKQNMIAKLAQTVSVSPGDIEKFYSTYADSLPMQPESVSLSHLLVKFSPSESTKVKSLQKAEKVLGMLRSGEDFRKLAREYSDDPVTKGSGGYLGAFEKGSLLPEIERVAFSMEPGHISDIIETQLGFHIIRVEKKKGDTVELSHILIYTTPDVVDKQKALERIRMIRGRALSGEDFSELAKKYSEDETTKGKGGFLMWAATDELPEDIREIVKDMKPGDISEPIDSENGYHIVRLDERVEGGPITIEKNYDIIRNMVLQSKIDKVLQEAIEKQRERIYVEVKIEI